MIKYLLNKIRDKLDTEVSMVIVMSKEDIIYLLQILNAIDSVKIDPKSYATRITDHECMIEFRIPYNKYLKFMNKLHEKGYNLKAMSNVDLINKIVKVDN